MSSLLVSTQIDDLYDGYLAAQPDKRSIMAKVEFKKFCKYIDYINNEAANSHTCFGEDYSRIKFDKRIKCLFHPATVSLVTYNDSTVHDLIVRQPQSDIDKSGDFNYSEFLYLQNKFISGFIRRGTSVNQDCTLEDVRLNVVLADVIDRLCNEVLETTVDDTKGQDSVIENPITVKVNVIPYKGTKLGPEYKEAVVIMFRRLYWSLRQNNSN